jgi:hypothetical protein
VYGYWDKGLIENNVIHNIGRYAVHIYSHMPVNNWVVRNNRFFDCGIRGTYKKETGLQQTAALIVSRGINHLVYNNLVYKNFAGIRVWGNADNALVANNSVYGNQTYGIKVDGDRNENTRIVNNISWGNREQISDQGTSTRLESNLTTDPKFVDAAKGNFQLQSGSAAIRSGVNLYALFTTDFTGAVRPKTGAWNSGAFGGVALPPGSAPNPPSMFVVQ